MRRYFVLMTAFALAACTHHDDAGNLTKAAVSWSATMQMVADARLRGTVPKAYVLKTIESAVGDLSAQAAKPSLPQALTKRAEAVIGIGTRLHDAVESDDDGGIEAARRQLVAASAGLQ